jgi:hypothetical protein
MPASTRANLLMAMILFAQAPLPANAADMAGKWYGRLDSEALITIARTGSGYSASLDYPDITKSVQRTSDIQPIKQAIHKDLASFEAAGNRLHFIIRSTISWYGDTNFTRDDYNLTLSDDGRQLTGTVRRVAMNDGNDGTNHSVPQAVTPITLFSTDWNSRSAAGAKN